jgi:hypothetical protein
MKASSLRIIPFMRSNSGTLRSDDPRTIYQVSRINYNHLCGHPNETVLANDDGQWHVDRTHQKEQTLS